MPKPLPGHAPVQATQRRLGPIILVGVLAGFLAGLFGVGGGLLIVPGLVFAGMDQRLAHGTSLAAVVPIAVASLITYASGGNVDWPAALWLSVGAAGGVVIGTKLLHILPVRTLGLLFSAVLVASAVRLFFETDASGRTRSRSPMPSFSWPSGSSRGSWPVCSASAAASSRCRR